MNWKIEGLKRVDGILGGLGCAVSKLLVSPRAGTDKDNPAILVIRPGGIGDAVLLYPALAELRNGFANSRIDVLAEKRNGGILEECPYINHLLLYDRSPLETFRRVLRGGYDIVIDTEQWHRLTAVVSYLARAPVRVGFETNARAGLLSCPVPYSQGDYEAVSFLNLVSAVTGKEYEFRKNESFMPVDSGVNQECDDSISEFRRDKKAVVGMFTGATVPERRWGAAKFAELSKELSRDDIGTVVVGGKADIEDSVRFKQLAGHSNIMDFTGRTSLVETASVISRLDEFVTGDTGLMHVAYGVGTPTVSLFGAGIEEKWAPPGEGHIAINRNMPCSPCTKFGYTPRCPYQVRCLHEITVEEVKESVLELLYRTVFNKG